jgi:hypothetical protein
MRLDEGIGFQYVAKGTQACRKLTMELAISSTSLFNKEAKWPFRRCSTGVISDQFNLSPKLR